MATASWNDSRLPRVDGNGGNSRRRNEALEGGDEENLECTFTPEISKRPRPSKGLGGVCAELSAGDALRKETTRDY